jgi:hypothetical protein
MNDAIDFGYNICGHYNLNFPAPKEIIKILGLDHPPAIDFPSTIENVTFSDSLPPIEEGARADIGGYEVKQPFASVTALPALGNNVETSYTMGLVVLAGVIGGFLI